MPNLTAELLNTIFWPGSLLHDMGVVIRSGKPAAAGVQFPLAEGEPESPRNWLPPLGRDWASLQETDAVIVVVSEETGTISVAENGRLIRSLTVEGLRNRFLWKRWASNFCLCPPGPAAGPGNRA